MQQHELTVPVKGRGMIEITQHVCDWVASSGIRQGLLTLFVRHTSCSLIVQENADPDVRHDMELFFSTLVKDGNPAFLHRNEGDDDMSAHIRSAMLGVSLNIPVSQGKPVLGTWQGIFLYEHRERQLQRRVFMHLA
jgi:secondary thiamine-phosphate synthase enzyme